MIDIEKRIGLYRSYRGDPDKIRDANEKMLQSEDLDVIPSQVASRKQDLLWLKCRGQSNLKLLAYLETTNASLKPLLGHLSKQHGDPVQQMCVHIKCWTHDSLLDCDWLIERADVS